MKQAVLVKRKRETFKRRRNKAKKLNKKNKRGNHQKADRALKGKKRTTTQNKLNRNFKQARKKGKKSIPSSTRKKSIKKNNTLNRSYLPNPLKREAE